MIQITYIWHDCFVVELSEVIMIFDFWKDPASAQNEIPEFINNADKNKTLYVFVSHHHKDHFSKHIFKWESMFKRAVFILSEDVAKHIRHILTSESIYNGIRPSADNCIILSQGQDYCDDLIKVEAYGSTDIGNSYYIELIDPTSGPLTFFHAGDLNAWLWAEESTPEEVNDALNNFKEILQTISANHAEIGYVMFPVDSRIGRGYATGAHLFVTAIKVKHFFPMHFGLGESAEELQRRSMDAANIKLYANPDMGDYICLQAPYGSYFEG